MTNDVRDQMKRARSVLAYRNAHPENFGGAKATELVGIVETSLSRLTDLGADQTAATGSSLAGTGNIKALVSAVRDDLILIRQTARTIVKNGGTLDYPFDVAASEAYDIVIATGEAFYSELNKAGVAQRFLDWEIRADFLEDLRADLDNYENIVGTRDDATQERKDAVRDSDEAAEQLIRALDGLDTLFRNKFQDDKSELAAWREASHLERTRVHPRKPEPPTA